MNNYIIILEIQKISLMSHDIIFYFYKTKPDSSKNSPEKVEKILPLYKLRSCYITFDKKVQYTITY